MTNTLQPLGCAAGLLLFCLRFSYCGVAGAAGAAAGAVPPVRRVCRRSWRAVRRPCRRCIPWVPVAGGVPVASGVAAVWASASEPVSAPNPAATASARSETTLRREIILAFSWSLISHPPYLHIAPEIQFCLNLIQVEEVDHARKSTFRAPGRRKLGDCCELDENASAEAFALSQRMATWSLNFTLGLQKIPIVFVLLHGCDVN